MNKSPIPNEGKASEEHAKPKQPKIQKMEEQAEESKNWAIRQQGSTRRSFGEAMRSMVQQHLDQSKRRRTTSNDDTQSNSNACRFKGNLQRGQAEVRRGINGSICKREVNAITNLINARCDNKMSKTPTHI